MHARKGDGLGAALGRRNLSGDTLRTCPGLLVAEASVETGAQWEHWLRECLGHPTPVLRDRDDQGCSGQARGCCSHHGDPVTSSWQGNRSPGAQHPPAALTQTHEAVKALQAPLHPLPARKGLRHPGAQHIFGDPRYSHQLTVRSQPCSSASGPRPCPNPSRWRRTSAGAGGRCRGPGEGPGRPGGARRTARTALGTAGVCWFVRGWTGLIPVGPHWAALGWTGLC